MKNYLVTFRGVGGCFETKLFCANGLAGLNNVIQEYIGKGKAFEASNIWTD